MQHLIRQHSDVTGPALPVTHLAVFIMIPSQTAWAEVLHPSIAQPWKCDLRVCIWTRLLGKSCFVQSWQLWRRSCYRVADNRIPESQGRCEAGRCCFSWQLPNYTINVQIMSMWFLINVTTGKTSLLKEGNLKLSFWSRNPYPRNTISANPAWCTNELIVLNDRLLGL